MTHKELRQNLEQLGISEGCIGDNMTVNGSNAVFLGNNDGVECFYTGFDIVEDSPLEDHHINYQQYLKDNFS